jgi:hypothetical protein
MKPRALLQHAHTALDGITEPLAKGSGWYLKAGNSVVMPSLSGQRHVGLQICHP